MIININSPSLLSKENLKKKKMPDRKLELFGQEKKEKK